MKNQIFKPLIVITVLSISLVACNESGESSSSQSGSGSLSDSTTSQEGAQGQNGFVDEENMSNQKEAMNQEVNSLHVQEQRSQIVGVMKYLAVDSMKAEGITRSRADSLFNNYHGTRKHEESTGPMVVVDENDNREALIHYSLSYDSVIVPLLNKVNNDPSVRKFLGFAGIHGKYMNNGSNTMIWVAVIEKSDGRAYYYLPSNSQANDETYLYDYVDVCPDNCPVNEDRLWNVGWAE